MATTTHHPPITDSSKQGDMGTPGGVTPASGTVCALDDSSPASRTGIWIAMAAITMSFASLTSAMVVLQGASNDWRHFALPGILYLNTVVLLLSSVALELARKRVVSFLCGPASGRGVALLWLSVAVGLGFAFVAGQYAAWLKLGARGLYMATNPGSSFFYLFTGVHSLHVLGGILGLLLVAWRLGRPVPTLKVSTLSTVTYYWHFVDLLWIYLLVLLWARV